MSHTLEAIYNDSFQVECSATITAAFQIFCCRPESRGLRPIHKDDEAIWRALLLWSDVADIYAPGDNESALDIVRRMTPGAHSNPRHWAAFFPLDFKAENIPVDVASDIDDENADRVS